MFAASSRATAFRGNSSRRLVDLIMENKFPIGKMIKFYDFADINLAAMESAAGIAIKPVLRMPESM